MGDDTPDFAALRAQMVDEQLVARGVEDSAVLHAMRTVPRELFVPFERRTDAYKDGALPLFAGQTISQPFVVAMMCSYAALRRDDRVLEIGAGSGYAAAVISRIVSHVYAIERILELAEFARANVKAAGYDNVTIIQGDGTLGLPDRAPFDAILVAANSPRIPKALREQLALGGRLVIPVGRRKKHRLVRITRTAENSYKQINLNPVRFVPLIGEEGWKVKNDEG